MQRLPNFNYRSFFWKFATIVLIFAIDRASKIYLLNLQENGIEVDRFVGALPKETVKEKQKAITGLPKPSSTADGFI